MVFCVQDPCREAFYNFVEVFDAVLQFNRLKRRLGSCTYCPLSLSATYLKKSPIQDLDASNINSTEG